MTFKKGDKVVCVNDSEMDGRVKLPEVTKGKEYTVYSPGIKPEFVCIMGADNMPDSPQSLYSSRFVLQEKADCIVLNHRGETETGVQTEKACVDYINALSRTGEYRIVRVVKILKVEIVHTVKEI